MHLLLEVCGQKSVIGLKRLEHYLMSRGRGDQGQAAMITEGEDLPPMAIPHWKSRFR